MSRVQRKLDSWHFHAGLEPPSSNSEGGRVGRKLGSEDRAGNSRNDLGHRKAVPEDILAGCWREVIFTNCGTRALSENFINRSAHSFSSKKRASFRSVAGISLNEWLTYFNVKTNQERLPTHLNFIMACHVKNALICFITINWKLR